MSRLFRKYHRQLAIALSIPFLLTILTGVGYTIFDEWFHQEEIGEFLLDVHTLKILHLEAIYPVLNALGLIALLFTGLNLTGLFRDRSKSRET